MEEMHQPPQVGPNMMAGVGGVPNHSNNVNRRNRVRVTLHAMMLEKLPLHEAARLEMKSLPSKTPVSVLQELLSRRGTIPKYELVQIEGAIHEPTFRYRVTVTDVVGSYNIHRASVLIDDNVPLSDKFITIQKQIQLFQQWGPAGLRKRQNTLLQKLCWIN